MLKENALTPAGQTKLEDELRHLETVRRREVGERIKEAREFGDISENSEYDDAKNEQAMLETRILQVEENLRSALVVTPEDVDTEAVHVGNAVTVKFDDGKPQTFTIVGSAEADPPRRLSNVSPVGKALMGKKKGDEVTINLPSGSTRSAKITKIDVGL